MQRNPVVRLNSKETKTTWENGKEFTSYFKDGFIVHCAYHGTTGTYMVFDIEMANTTDEEFLLGPETIVMFTDSGKWDPEINQIVYSTFPIFAIDPEIEILNNELAISQLEANQKNLATASIAVAAMSLPVMAAMASTDANDTKQRAIYRVEAATAGTTLSLSNYSQEMNSIRNELLHASTNAWISNSPRKTTLSSNESVRGLAYFKKPDLKKYRDLRIDVPIGENNFISFNYKVLLYYPTTPSSGNSLR